MNEQPVRRRIRASERSAVASPESPVRNEVPREESPSRFSRGAEETENGARFASPYKFDDSSLSWSVRETPALSDLDMPAEEGYMNGTVYRRAPREEAPSVPQTGYDTQAPAPRKKKKKKRRATLWCVLIVLALAAAAFALLSRDASVASGPSASPLPAATARPLPASSFFEAGETAAVSAEARSAIGRIASKMSFDSYQVNDSLILASQRKAGGLTDVCVFSADQGKLLCYFEDIPENGAFLQPDGGAYAAQSPFEIRPDGSAMIPRARLEGLLGEGAVLHPFYEGIACAESADGRERMVLDAEGNTVSDMRFARVFPFTADYTLAYLDTGSGEKPYVLYVLSREGEMTRWMSASGMEDVALCVSGYAFLQNGEVYRLPDLSAPLDITGDITVYPDYDAAVFSGADGKKALRIRGEEYYPHEFTEIRPVETEIAWETADFLTEGGRVTVAVTAGDVRPLTYSFALTADGNTEYVALSAEHNYPVLKFGGLAAAEVLP